MSATRRKNCSKNSDRLINARRRAAAGHSHTLEGPASETIVPRASHDVSVDRGLGRVGLAIAISPPPLQGLLGRDLTLTYDE